MKAQSQLALDLGHRPAMGREDFLVTPSNALAVAWIIGEWLRAQFLWGFPWNLIGYVWIAVLPISQIAAFVGVYGLGLAAVLTGALWLTLLVENDRLRWLGPGLSALMVTLLLAGGGLRLAGKDVRFRTVAQPHAIGRVSDAGDACACAVSVCCIRSISNADGRGPVADQAAVETLIRVADHG